MSAAIPDRRRNDGTTGLVIGAIAGGVLGNAIGGDMLGAGGGGFAGAVTRPR